MHNILSSFILVNQFNICVYFLLSIDLKIIILISKFSKHNRVNIYSCKIKYLDLYLSLDFLNFIFRFMDFYGSIKVVRIFCRFRVKRWLKIRFIRKNKNLNVLTISIARIWVITNDVLSILLYLKKQGEQHHYSKS